MMPIPQAVKRTHKGTIFPGKCLQQPRNYYKVKHRNMCTLPSTEWSSTSSTSILLRVHAHTRASAQTYSHTCSTYISSPPLFTTRTFKVYLGAMEDLWEFKITVSDPGHENIVWITQTFWYLESLWLPKHQLLANPRTTRSLKTWAEVATNVM